MDLAKITEFRERANALAESKLEANHPKGESKELFLISGHLSWCSTISSNSLYDSCNFARAHWMARIM